jgi:hypothetical protein
MRTLFIIINGINKYVILQVKDITLQLVENSPGKDADIVHCYKRSMVVLYVLGEGHYAAASSEQSRQGCGHCQ